MAGKLEGKVAFITGAARGQGRSHAVRFAQEGADIIAVDLCESIETVPYGGATRADLDETVRQVEALDRRIIASVADTRSLEQMKAAVDNGVAELGRLDVVMANAGIATFAQAAEMTEEMWRTMIDINLSGVFFSIQPAIPHLVAAGGGAVIITSSTAGLKGMANIAHYSAAKHGVVGLMRSLANELAPHRIRVNTIHPTNVDTDMIQNAATKSVFFGGDGSGTKEQFAEAATPMNMLPIPWVEVADITNAALFLASDEGRYVTAIQLPVDAGATQK
jgi:SDR family mycofactocin-dependent oxidoreductase